MSRDKNLQKENEMGSPTPEVFHAQLDCTLTFGKTLV